MRPLSTFLASLGVFAASVSALNPIEVQQQEFINSKTGDRFVILGVDYQPGGQAAVGTGNGDPLSNPKACLRDAALMQDLGVNTIRTYNIDPTLDHDECVSIFSTVGIYMIIDVNSPLDGQYMDRSNPSSTYTEGYLQHVFTVIEAFKNYDNLLGFFAGNEIINNVPTTKNNPQYIRAVQRDMKEYIKNNSPRTIPVGYSAADVRDDNVLEDTWAYLQCQIGSGDDMTRSDFFGLNSYSWCGDASNFQLAGYDVLAETFGQTTIPVFFSEYGCNDPQPRYFEEVPSLYGPKMTVMSGGLVYEWTEEESDYGIVTLKDDGSLKLRQDYEQLRGKYDKLDISLLEHQNSTATKLDPPKCDAKLIKGAAFSKNFNIPNTPSGAESLIKNGISKPPSGKIVKVTQTVVQVPITQANGDKISNLQIVPGATQANFPGAVKGFATTAGTIATPGSGNGGGNGGNGGSGGGSSSSSGLAPRATGVDQKVVGAVAALGAVAFAF